MLLLVLILVLIAFGLLVVALLTGSVLWAWVSVGVSVAAAAVLLVDWLQRRSAVKAGAEAGDAVPTPPAAPVPPPHTPERQQAVEPATEVFPAVRADGQYDGSAPAGFEPAPDSRRDERPDTRETVVMRAFAPSGSTEGPSGAHDGFGPTGPDLSQSVTNRGADGGPSFPPQGGIESPYVGTAGAPDVDPDSQTVKVVGTAGREPGARDEPPAGAGPQGGSGHAAAPATVVGMRPDLPALGPDGAPPEEPHDAEAVAVVAGLDDEVLVVDELPRYHVAGCRSLGNTPVIPLPAREAVELGFTPCAWCAPDRTLAARHHAPVR